MNKNYWATRDKHGVAVWRIKPDYDKNDKAWMSASRFSDWTAIIPEIAKKAIKLFLKGKRGEKAICKVSVDTFCPIFEGKRWE